MVWMRLAGLAAVMATGACARAQDVGKWADVEHLKRGTVVLVETQPPRWGPPLEERCWVEASDAATLTCKQTDGLRQRLVFPAREVSAVYRIRHKFGVPSLLATSGLTLVLLGVVSPYVALAGVVLLAASLVARVAADVGNFADARAGVPPAPPGERLQVVYYGGFQP